MAIDELILINKEFSASRYISEFKITLKDFTKDITVLSYLKNHHKYFLNWLMPR